MKLLFGRPLLICAFSSLLVAVLSFDVRAGSFLFSQSGIVDWEEKSFVGMTRYQLVEQDNKRVLSAKAMGTSSGLFNTSDIILDETPLLNWRWKVSRIGSGNDEKTKSGDDYPVRLYVIVSGGLQFWKSYSLVYVWSNSAKLNESWDNPYTSNVKHIAVETGTHNVGKWRSYQRNVKADFAQVFGVKPKKIKAVAIMTDSDNSGQNFESWYGDIQFKQG